MESHAKVVSNALQRLGTMCILPSDDVMLGLAHLIDEKVDNGTELADALVDVVHVHHFAFLDHARASAHRDDRIQREALILLTKCT